MKMTMIDADNISYTFKYQDFKKAKDELTDESDDEDDDHECCQNHMPKKFKALYAYQFRVCDAFDEECRRQQYMSEEQKRLAEANN